MLHAVGIRSWVPALVAVVAVVSGVRAVVRTPFTLPRALRHAADRPTGLRRWLEGELTIVVATVAVGTVATLPLYALLRATPVWWLPASLLFAAVTVGWQVLMPVAVRAQAGPLTPAPPVLAERLGALARRAGVDIGDGVVVAGKPGKRRCNAYVLGMGPTRRVVLEQAIAEWPPELVEQAVAHELGHWRLGHTARRLPLTLLSQLATLAAAAAVLSYRPLLDWAGVTGAGDPRSYPLLLVVGAVVVLPARCLLAWRDRAQERAADHFALTLLDRPADFAAMLQRAADESGAPRTLPWWRRLTATHPPVDERAALSLGARA
ncbi:MAG TPA: M48 family metalloprotease [Acidimicrobiales bacterium]|nr:M48 family metalloprotease [Acidimicrobiales bacterium]